MVRKNVVCQTSVVAKGGRIAKKLLVEPGIKIAQHKVFAVTGQRARKTGNAVKNRFCRLDEPEGHVIAHGLHLGKGVCPLVLHFCTARNSAHLGIAEGLHHFAYCVRLQKTVGINKNQKLKPGPQGSGGKGMPLAHVVGLLHYNKAVARNFLANLLFKTAHPLHGFICAAIVHKNNLELFLRVILIDGRLDCFFDPFFLVEAGNHNGDPGRKIWVNGYVAVKKRKNETAHQKNRSNDAVCKNGNVKHEVKQTFLPHVGNSVHRKRKQQYGNNSQPQPFFEAKVLVQITHKIDGYAFAAVLAVHMAHNICRYAHTRFVPFGQRAGGHGKPQHKLAAHIWQGRISRPVQQHAR